MEELLKIAIESGSFGLSVFIAYVLFKKFIEDDVIKPIEETKNDQADLKKSFTQFTERVTGFVFRVIKSNQELSDRVTKEVTGMHNLFTEATRHTSIARLEANESLKKVNSLEQTTDKLVKIASAVHQKNASLESQIVEIGKELILVKTKVDKK